MLQTALQVAEPLNRRSLSMTRTLRFPMSIVALVLWAVVQASPAPAQASEPAPPAPWAVMGDAWLALPSVQQEQLKARYEDELGAWEARQHPGVPSDGSKGLLAATWNQVGPEVASVKDIAFDPTDGSRVFAVLDGGYALSTDGGVSWSLMPVETTALSYYYNARIAVAASNPSVVYATNDRYLYTSTDGGTTWSEHALQIDGATFFPDRLAVDPNDASTVYLADSRYNNSGGGYDLQVARSTDGGATWTIAGTLGHTNSSSGFEALEVNATGTLFAGTYDYSSGRTVRISRSVDGGGTWAEVYSTAAGFYGSLYDFEIDASGNMFAGGGFADGQPRTTLIRSTDGGDTWVEMETPVSAFGLTSSATAGGPLYMTDAQNVYVSSDDGDTWTELGALFGPASSWHVPAELAVDPTDDQHLIAGTIDQGFYVSTAGGTAWASSNAGLHLANPGAALVDPTDPDVIWMAAGLLWHTTDGGATWESVPEAGLVSLVAADPTNGDVLYTKDCCSTLRRTADGGATWETVYLYSAISNASFNGMMVGPDGSLYLTGTKYDLSRAYFAASHDGGDSWDWWPLSTDKDPRGGLVAPGNGRLYTVLYDYNDQKAAVFSTTTDGKSEYRSLVDPEAANGSCCGWTLAVGPTGSIYVGGQTYGNNMYHSLWVSDDGTASFTPLRTSQSWEQVYAIAFDPSGSAMFVAGERLDGSSAVLSSTDGGTTWEQEVGSGIGKALALTDDGTNLHLLAGMQTGGLMAATVPSYGPPATPTLPPAPPAPSYSVSLVGPAIYDHIGSGFPIPVSLTATDLQGARVIQVVLDVGNQGHFDLSSATYTPPTDFSVQSIDANFDHVTVTATTLGSGLTGDADLGSITLPTSASFGASTEALVRVKSVGVGADLDHLETLIESQIGIEISVNVPRVVANAAPVGPTLDGAIGGPEWASAGQPLSVEFTSDPTTPPGIVGAAGPPADDDDLSYKVYALYTATDLFIGVEVTDDVVQSLESTVWQNDDIEVYIDGDGVSNDLGSGFGNGNAEGFQLIVDAAGNKLADGLTAGLDWDVEVQTTATGWSAEFQIPLNSIDVTDGAGQAAPGPGATLGFNVVVYDDDSATGFYVDGEDTYGRWVGTGSSFNESEWGELILSDIPPPPPILALLLETSTSNCGGPLPVGSLPDVMEGCGQLEAGFANGATDGRDAEWDEVEQPPVPPSGVFDARFTGINTLRDLRDFPPAEVTEVAWTFALQAGSGGYPVTVSWDPAALSKFSGTFTLSDAFGGSVFSVNLNTDDDGVFEITNAAVTSATLTYNTVTAGECTYSLPSGWSMISLCGTPTSGDATLATNFPEATSLFRFAGGYQAATELAVGEGYWINMPSAADYTIAVSPSTQVALDLPAGWSMIGGPNAAIDVAGLQTATPDVTSVFGFAGGYSAATTIDPGQGYWINMANAATFNLPPAAAKVVPTVSAGPLADAVLWAEADGHRQQLQLGVEPQAVVELPPRPMAGVLDARVLLAAGQGSWQVPLAAAPTDYVLTVQGTDVTLGWDLPAAQSQRWQLVLGDGQSPRSLDGSGQLNLGTHAEPVRLTLRQLSGLPDRFALSQNWPNPFNPATSIAYDLKAGGPVSLAIYDVTGQLVRRLVDGSQPAGRYTVNWDGRNDAGMTVATGLYFYELRAGSFRATHKMLLMK